MVKGTKKGKSGLFGDPDIISDGSGIVVADGQCALIVDEGQILEVAAEPGNYTFDTSSSPSIFSGGLQGIKDTFAEMVGRFTYGGVAAKTQRVYFVNTKEIMGNMFGTATPIPFKVSDPSINLNLLISLRCNGEYSFKIVNPLLFYKNVAGNQSSAYNKETLVGMMKSEMLTAMQPAFGKLSAMHIDYTEIPLHTMELADALNEQLSEKWTNGRGIKIVSMGINSISAPKEDEDRIKNRQMSATLTSAQDIAATLAQSRADSMRDAANNPNGPAVAMMGVNAMGGDDGLSQALNIAAQQQAAAQTAPKADSWKCPKCGATVGGNFCSVCGEPKPAQAAGGFCPNCGKPVEAGSKFCSNCGKAL